MGGFSPRQNYGLNDPPRLLKRYMAAPRLLSQNQLQMGVAYIMHDLYLSVGTFPSASLHTCSQSREKQQNNVLYNHDNEFHLT